MKLYLCNILACLLALLVSACGSGFPDTLDDIFAEANQTGEEPLIYIRHKKKLKTDETGVTGNFRVFLREAPADSVTINLSSNRPEEGEPDQTSITFTPGEWQQEQLVTVYGVDDDYADGVQEYRIITSPAVSGDDKYNGFDPRDVRLKNHDDDSSGIYFSPADGLVTGEDGSQAAFDVVLDCEPKAEVVITLASSDPGEGTISPNVIRFDPGNWQTAKTVTITGRDDNDGDGPVAYTINVVSVMSQDAAFKDLTIEPVSVINMDNEPSTPGITVIPDTPLITDEGGRQARIKIRLDTQPEASVTIGISSNNTGEALVSPSSVTFTPGNWYMMQTITLTGQPDGVRDANQNYALEFGTSVSSDDNYSGITLSNVNLSNVNKDKFLFQTIATIDGAIGGTTAGAITNADAVCNSDSARPDTGATYKAVIVNSSRVASASPAAGNGQIDWALGINTTYYRADGGGVIFTTGMNRLFIFGFATNSVNNTGTSYWTGLNSNWTKGTNCAGFTDNSASSRVGEADRTGTDMITKSSESCSVARALLCAEQ